MIHSKNSSKTGQNGILQIRKLCPVFLLLACCCWTSVLRAQQDWESFQDSSWIALQTTFDTSDDLAEVWPQLRKIEEASISQHFGDFLEHAIPFVTQCYEYGLFSGSALYLQHLESLLSQADIPEELADHRCDVLYHLGRLHVMNQQPEIAKNYTEASIDCQENRGLKSIWEYNLLGAISQDLNKLDSAGHYYRLALANIIADSDVEDGEEEQIRENLADILYQSGLTRQAKQEYEEILAMKIQTLGPKDVAVASILGNLAACEDELGLYTAAIQHYEEALQILSTNDLANSVLAADLYLNLGVSYKTTSAYDDAVRYYARARAIYENQPEPPVEKLALVISNMALVYSAQKNFDQAIVFHKKSLAINEQEGNEAGIANDYTNLGRVASQMGNWSLAKSYYERALETRKDLADFKADLAVDHINLADAYLALEEFIPAMIHAETAAALQRAILGKRNPQRAYALTTKARIARAQGRLNRALELVHKSLIANHESFNSNKQTVMPPLEGYFRYDYLLESLLLKAEMLKEASEKYDDPESLIEAQIHYRHALDLLEIVGRELSSREDQITLAQNVYRTAAAAMQGYLTLYEDSKEIRWVEDAFHCSEKSKASVLHAAIIANEAQYFAGIPTELPEREAQLQADIGYYKRQLSTVSDSLRRRELQSKLFTSQGAYNDLLRSYREQYPEYYDLRHEQQLPSISSVQFALLSNQTILSYFTTDTQVYRFEISKSQVAFNSTPLPRRFASDIRGLNKGIIRRLDAVYLKKAQQFGQLLLPKQLPDEIQELILVPDGLLLRIPFETLLMEASEETDFDYSSLPYLIQDYRIQYTPSVALLHQSQSTTIKLNASETSGLLAYAPVFPGTTAIQEATRSNPFAGESILPLPETEREVSQLARLFLEKDRVAEASLYHSANERALKESDLSNYRFLHVATHGFVNEEDPDLSGLLLYPDSTAGEDGLLAVGEVYNLKLNTELVTLSACETGIGQIANGEGVLGFTRAFLYAGAERVMVSLWQVQDAATADLMLGFYERVLQETAPDYSSQLRQAKLQLIKSKTYSHPYYWSPFILIRG